MGIAGVEWKISAGVGICGDWALSVMNMGDVKL